jgi:hypothetical protein
MTYEVKNIYSSVMGTYGMIKHKVEALKSKNLTILCSISRDLKARFKLCMALAEVCLKCLKFKFCNYIIINIKKSSMFYTDG